MERRFGAYSVRQQADAIVCRKCGKSGEIIWDDGSRRNMVTPELVDIDGPFFERLGRIARYPIELVCRGGGAAMTAYPSTSLHARGKYN